MLKAKGDCQHNTSFSDTGFSDTGFSETGFLDTGFSVTVFLVYLMFVLFLSVYLSFSCFFLCCSLDFPSRSKTSKKIGESYP